MKSQKNKKYEDWVLHSGMYEVFWQKETGQKVRIEGAEFVAIETIREAIANYVRGEGCSCCESDDHKDHREILGKLLSIGKYKDGSGYDFHRYAKGK